MDTLYVSGALGLWCRGSWIGADEIWRRKMLLAGGEQRTTKMWCDIRSKKASRRAV